jgi:5-methylcytosine-specific restriction endonuclease McrA
VRAVSDRRRKRDAVYPQRRQEVWERGTACVSIAGHGGYGEVHHIAGRGGPDPHRLSNLVGLCAECHRRAHSEPVWARRVGLMATRHRQTS